MKYSVEVMRVREQTIQLNGWAVESNPDSALISVFRMNMERIIIL